MDDIESLEKLVKLKDKNIINEEEYTALKKGILAQTMHSEYAKSGIAYALLAAFLGSFGAHNFYAGYTKRAIVQLLMSLFSWVLLFIPLFIVNVWALLDLCLINKDARGVPFHSDKILVMIIRIAAVAIYGLSYFMFFLGIFMSIALPIVAQS